MGNNWIECKSKLPEEKESYLAWDDYRRRIITSVYNPHHNCWDNDEGDDYYTDAVGGNITHWMELPNKPFI